MKKHFFYSSSVEKEKRSLVEEKHIHTDLKRFPRIHFSIKDSFSYLRVKIIFALNILWQISSLILLLILYLSQNTIKTRYYSLKHTPVFLDRTIWKYAPFFSRLYTKAIQLLDKSKSGVISRIDLIDLAVRNIKGKKTRSIVTVGGMAIGIATIVFLVSIGYGLQRLVVSRVAHLGELKQLEVGSQIGGQVKIDSTSLSQFRDITGVKLAIPLISLVGKITYHNSQTDVAAYATTKEYMQYANIKLLKGKLLGEGLKNNTIPVITYQEPVVSSPTPPQNQVSFTIDSQNWIRVRSSPDTNAPIIGYTKQVGKTQEGEEVKGKSYLSEDASGKAGKDVNGEIYGKWIKSSVLLWEKNLCEVGQSCVAEYIKKTNNDGLQTQKIGYFAEVNLLLVKSSSLLTNVLGDTTASSSATSSASEFITIASLSATLNQQDVKKIPLGEEAKKQAIVNRTMLKILNIDENEAIGKKFTVSFAVTSDLTSKKGNNIESSPDEYIITGIISEDKTPIFYLSLDDLKNLEITTYSQATIVANDEGAVRSIRKTIEALGYTTHSVVDTVDQINSIFQTVTLLLTIIGLIALAVAALGMFNTLTVSLLERTREVGLLKAMGMKSEEIQELFLTESFIMSFLGSTVGILIGFIAGKILSVLLSVIAIAKGVGFIDISYIPFSLIGLIIVLSIIVGIGTGIYPARRATKISALNALRYE